jgi:two-component system, OmpR family, sensor histidine kinase AdeS
VRFLPHSFRWQIAVAMALAAFSSMAVMIGGISLFGYYFESYYTANVPSETLAALKAFDGSGNMTREEIDLVRLFYSSENIRVDDLYPLLAFSFLGVVIGLASGLRLGAKLVRPIESVTRAAHEIATGNLDARAKVESHEKGESSQLVANFNTLADGLSEAERELAESASAIAHELRTPVTILKARLQAVNDGILSLSEKELAGLIGQVDLLSAIIDDMRDLSLAGAKQLDFSPRKIDLAVEIDIGLQSMRGSLTQAGFTIETNFVSAVAFADPARVRQILNALVSNVLRYAASGKHIRLEIKSENSFAVLTVLDLGPGLPEGETEKLFDRFWRGEVSRSRETGGTGLGLAVVKAIVLAHGGTVTAFNRAGGGAVFTVKFPARSNKG